MSHFIKPIVLEAMARFEEVHVGVSGNDTRVELPRSFEGKDRVVIRFEPRNPRNVQGLTIDDSGIGALMSFNRAPFTVRIPWDAIELVATPSYVVQVRAPRIERKPGLRVVK